jgi:DNA-binding LacI/PurR family transcriptional regulator
MCIDLVQRYTINCVSDMANIQDVARLAKVSPSTVSNFFNNRLDRMQAVTRERVQHAVTELGFIPNRIARQLKTGHVPIIGLLVPTVANPFFGELATAIQEAAQNRGYQVVLNNTGRDAKRELAFASELVAMGVRGLISGSALLRDEHASALAARGLAVVAFDVHERELVDPQVDIVSLDNCRATLMAVEHLVSLGHSRITYVTLPPEIASRAARLAGFQAAIEKHDLFGRATVYSISSDPKNASDGMIGELGRRAAIDIAAKKERPTAVIASNDLLAVGISAGLRESNIRIPEEISLVGIDDLFIAPLLNPPLTTIRQPLQKMAEAAVDCLVSRIEGQKQEATTHVFMPELVVRRSTARVLE